jgi:putative spermidine/putrescine transport system ATP-binding protein
MSSRLDLRGITRGFGRETVLRGVSLTVEPSRCTALLGASGSGKSTLLRIVAGLETASAGEVLVDGRPLDGVPTERRDIALVFQKPLLFPHLTVEDNVAFAARMAGRSRRSARAHAREFLDLVHLGELARRDTATLSGGQAQRVSLARALARTPRLLLLDEPFSSLDSQLREDMYALVGEIRSQLRPTIVLVTHDRREASVLAENIAVLDSGRILQHGPVPELHYRPASRAVSRILGGLNEIPGRTARGHHRSALGHLAVQEGAADGPGYLLVRQEAVRLVPAGTGTADGTVHSLTSTGAHTIVHLRLDGPSPDGRPQPLTAEVAGVPGLRVGDRTGVLVDRSSAWVVPG